LLVAESGRARRLGRIARRDLVPRPAGGRAALGRAVPRRAEAAGHRLAPFRPGPGQRHGRGPERHRVALRASDSRNRAVKNLVLLPEALVAAMAVIVLVAGRLGWFSPAARRSLPAV